VGEGLAGDGLGVIDVGLGATTRATFGGAVGLDLADVTASSPPRSD